MRYLIQNIKLPLEQRGNLLPVLTKGLGIKPEDLQEWQIVREAIDARKGQINFVYHVEFELRSPGKLSNKSKWEITPAPTRGYQTPQPGAKNLEHPPVVVGAGPAGLFAALLLAEMGYRPRLIERGAPIEERVRDVEAFWSKGHLNPRSNVQFGEGGAGTFSDGKLTTQIRDPRVFKVLREFVSCGAPDEILYRHKPHIGTDRLRRVVIRMRQRILDMGGSIHFHTKMDSLVLRNQQVVGVRLENGSVISTESVILAIGHSARETFETLFNQGVQMEAKAFSLGVRIEHLQEWIDAAQYHNWAGHVNLDPAEYKLVYHTTTGRTVYSFCMCPGGQVVASASEEGYLVTNGMSYYARDGKNANSALLVGVSPQDFSSTHPLAGIEFQREWEQKAFLAGKANYKAPIQRVDGFLKNHVNFTAGVVEPSYRPGVEPNNLTTLLPNFVVSALQEAIPQLGQKLRGFDHPQSILTGVESRSSSPLRIIRNPLGEANITGLFPAGEGAGYAGGIVSSAVDGLRSAELLIQQYRMR